MSIRKKAFLAVMVGNGIFGFSFLFSKTALNMTLPSVMLSVRFVTAFLVLNLIAVVGPKLKNREGRPLFSFSLRGKPWKYIFLLALFQPVIYFLAESYGIAWTSSAFAGTIIAVIPLAGILFDVVLMKVKVGKKQLLCSAASVIGVAVTTLGAEDTRSSVAGLFLLLAAVASGALFYVFSKKAGEAYNPLERTYVMFGIGSAVFTALALWQCKGQYEAYILIPLSSLEFWGCILYLAVVSSVIAFLLLNFGSSYVTVSEASIFANLTTVISIAAGIFIAGESFTLWQILGAAVIIGSLWVSNKA